MAGQNFNSVLLTPKSKTHTSDILAASLLRKSVVTLAWPRAVIQRENRALTIQTLSCAIPVHLEPGPRSVKDGTKRMTAAELSEQNPGQQELEDLCCCCC